jgi:hypothetical protein
MRDKEMLRGLGFISTLLDTPTQAGGTTAVELSATQRGAEPTVAAYPILPAQHSPCRTQHDTQAVATYPDRAPIELCAGHDSRWGQPRAAANGCYTVRITVDDDLTSIEGLDVLSEYYDKPIFIWVSIPCTGGSPWQRINIEANMLANWCGSILIKLVISLFDSVLLIAKHCGPNVKFAVEWLRQCEYWKHSAHRLSVEVSRFDACMYGLRTQSGRNSGLLIRKPWRVDTNCSTVAQQLRLTCGGSHQHARQSEAGTDRREAGEVSGNLHDLNPSEVGFRCRRA